ncbi:MAG: SRPBCC domain-containing protein, partial [Alphaproteobacteria bacterium]|nr:SRPBCC domain-containing protein [Alphaproteobacteria bacterium]
MSNSDIPDDRELVIDRYIDAPRELVWRCWTDPEQLVKWFTPAPWKTKSASMDVRAGGASMVVMESPEGEEFPNPGIYLEVIPGEKL